MVRRRSLKASLKSGIGAVGDIGWRSKCVHEFRCRSIEGPRRARALFSRDPTGHALERDTAAFGGGFATSPDASAKADLPAPVQLAGPCVTGSTTLCLNNGRFQVQVAWKVPAQGTSGNGTAVSLTGDTGYFWFFS